jgi:enoyl-[acyl-carrier protein] reductase I
VGSAVVEALAAEDVSFVLGYYNGEARARAAAEVAVERGAVAMCLPIDVGDGEAVRVAVEQARERIGAITDVVHAPAIGTGCGLADVSRRTLTKVVSVTGLGLTRVVRALESSLPRGASIVAITSPGATRYIPGYGPVGVAKAVMDASVRSLARDLTPRGIRVNAISPYIVDSPSARSNAFLEPITQEFRARTPAGAGVSGGDVGRVVAWLLDPATPVSGRVVAVDGGSLSYV